MNKRCFLIDVTEQRQLTVSVTAETAFEAVERVHNLQGQLESKLPKELVKEKTRIISEG